MRFLPLAVLFFGIPLLEIFLLINVGEVIGAWWTVLAVVATAVIGAFLIRAQGVTTLGRIQSNLAEGQVPAVEMMEGVCLLIAGALLMTPGFFTDSIGFALLIPPLRRYFIRQGLARSVVRGSVGGVWRRGHRDPFDAAADTASPRVGRTLETEYTRVDTPGTDDNKS